MIGPIAKVGALAVGVVMLLVGLMGASGAIAGAVSLPAAGPTLAVHLTVNASGSSGLAVDLQAHIAALPKGTIYVTEVDFLFNGNDYVYPHYNHSGYFVVNRTYTMGSAGVYSFTAMAKGYSALSPSVTYRATSAPLNVTVPVTSPGSCSDSACASVTSEFTYSLSGLAAVFTDRSVALNATVTSVSWDFGDGGTCAGAPSSVAACTGSPIHHTYATAGTYSVTEVVKATGLSGQVVSGTSTVSVTVSPSSSGSSCASACGGAGGVGSAIAAAFSGVTAVTLAFVFGGLGLVLAAVLPLDPVTKAMLVLVGLAAGAAIGFLAGGL